ncbi:hypothetical protein [Anabaena azotica]|uniref:Uncharacterized protein n=1 Tax=Anabaena azotica FACHB-119 TaxID=947527 RepID=A0ABR8DER9_9NOST|nr:hypothetical protein [Anabaena azotica]MBD2504875.1 hypothetical protein [Anabaena azotica FACHB-119]
MEATISIPPGWQYPRFTFGQRTQQGAIIGMRYYAADTFLGQEYGEGWRYIMLPDKNQEEERHQVEEEVKLLTPEELRTQLQAEIDYHSDQIEQLKSELASVPITVTVTVAESGEQNSAPISKPSTVSSPPSLDSLIDGAKVILREIAKHPDYLAFEYQPDLTVGDAQTALDYLQSGLEDSQKLDITSNIFP